MCGINGFTWKDRDLIEQMNAVTAHRGPDGSGTYYDEGISLGHNRLAIIDLSDAAGQPMSSPDGRLTIVYNGELYNFEELRRSLAKEWKFKTRSDTEVVLAAYAVWGKECVKRMNGMFAFAIWDKKRRELILARDPIGIKPLYYFYDGTKCIFSSEIKAILEHKDIPRTLSRSAMEQYFRLLYVPEPLTMFEYVRKLPPAHIAVLRGPGIDLERYWSVEAAHVQVPQTRGERAHALRDTIEVAVARQMVADRPVGVYLSGGIDSSAVLASAVLARGSIDTFSVGFELGEGEESEKFNADKTLAARVAAHWNTRHHEVVLRSDEVRDLLERAIWHLDEPISNPTALAQIKLAEFTKRSVAVALGGDGGDELFGGYERYRLSRIASTYQKYVPRAARAFLARNDRLAKLDTPAGVDRFALFMFQKNPVLSQVLAKPFVTDIALTSFRQHFFTPIEKDFERQFMNTDRQSWLVDECLLRSDKTSMSAGLEQRVPFLDKEVVEFAWQLSTDEKVSMRETKILLREAFRERLPAFLFDEPKRGWFSPAAKWLRRPDVSALAHEVLSREYAPELAPLFDWSGIERMLTDHQERREYNLTMLWALISFQMWAKRFEVRL